MPAGVCQAGPLGRGQGLIPTGASPNGVNIKAAKYPDR
jgi:hypothetical protein